LIKKGEKMNRAKFIGGSDIPAILGMSPWVTPLELYMRKIGEYNPKISDAQQKIFDRGHDLEPYVIKKIAQEFGIKILKKNKRYKDKQHKFLSCEIDAEGLLNGQDVNIEAKTCNNFARHLWDDGVPDYYVLQAQFGMMITGKSKTIFGVLLGLDHFKTYVIARSDKICDYIRAQAISFWLDHVKAKKPPEPASSKDIERFFDVQKGASIDANDDILALIDQIKDLQKKADDINDQITIHKERVKLFMRDNEILTCNNVEIAHFKRYEQKRFDVKALQKDQTDLYDKYCTTKEAVRFTIK
jgi:putative phage-type endonuclease